MNMLRKLRAYKMCIQPVISPKTNPKRLLFTAVLFIAACASNEELTVNSPPPEPVHLPTDPAIKTTGAAQNESAGQLADTAVSTDNFGVPDYEGIPGNGSGDLVLLVNDEGGTSPRKRSILIDLALKNNQGEVINDLTVNDIIDKVNHFSVNLPELSIFIGKSDDVTKINWQIFGIANHYTPGNKPLTVNLIRHGLVTTEPLDNKQTTNYKELHLSKAYRAALILSNNEYGIASNSSLESFTGEGSAYSQKLHGSLTNGVATTLKLDSCGSLIFHQLFLDSTLTDSSLASVKTDKVELGTACLSASDLNQTTLSLKP
jgi:hypothetical protein